jgi:hypothetical protein
MAELKELCFTETIVGMKKSLNWIDFSISLELKYKQRCPGTY